VSKALQLHLFKSRRQVGERAPLPLERNSHIAVADALRVGCEPGWLWTHFPAGEYRSEQTGALLKRMGLQRGWPDFLLIGPDGDHCWLELKRGKAPLTWEQKAFRDEMQIRGVEWALARSFDEAIEALRVWGALRLTVSA
jgi:hypothetical protein